MIFAWPTTLLPLPHRTTLVAGRSVPVIAFSSWGLPIYTLHDLYILRSDRAERGTVAALGRNVERALRIPERKFRRWRLLHALRYHLWSREVVDHLRSISLGPGSDGALSNWASLILRAYDMRHEVRIRMAYINQFDAKLFADWHSQLSEIQEKLNEQFTPVFLNSSSGS